MKAIAIAKYMQSTLICTYRDMLFKKISQPEEKKVLKSKE